MKVDFEGKAFAKRGSSRNSTQFFVFLCVWRRIHEYSVSYMFFYDLCGYCLSIIYVFSSFRLFWAQFFIGKAVFFFDFVPLGFELGLMDSNAKESLDSKAEFRKPSNDAANRKYRRRSPAAGSSSSSDGEFELWLRLLQKANFQKEKDSNSVFQVPSVLLCSLNSLMVEYSRGLW